MLDRISPELILFQTGYLTIKEVMEKIGRSPIYLLEMPNHEVKEAFAFLGRGDIEMKMEILELFQNPPL